MLVCGRALVMLFKVFTGIVFTRATDCAIAPLARGARSTRRAALGRGAATTTSRILPRHHSGIQFLAHHFKSLPRQGMCQS